MNYYLDVLKKYAVFEGRARRKEYWFFVLFNFLIGVGLGIIDNVIGLSGEGAAGGLLSLIYTLAVLVPSIAVAVRRLHDTDHSGWWLLIGFVPLIGIIVLFIFMVLDSQPGDNRFGPNPKAGDSPAAAEA